MKSTDFSRARVAVAAIAFLRTQQTAIAPRAGLPQKQTPANFSHGKFTCSNLTCRRPALWPIAGMTMAPTAIGARVPLPQKLDLPQQLTLPQQHDPARSSCGKFPCSNLTCRRPALWPIARMTMAPTTIGARAPLPQKLASLWPIAGMTMAPTTIGARVPLPQKLALAGFSRGEFTCRRPALWPNVR